MSLSIVLHCNVSFDFLLSSVVSRTALPGPLSQHYRIVGKRRLAYALSHRPDVIVSVTMGISCSVASSRRDCFRDTEDITYE